MRRCSKKALGTLAAATSLAMVGGGLATADDVTMNPQSLHVLAGGTGTFTVKLSPDNDGNAVDPVVGCNATPAAPVRITFTADDAWATPTPASVDLSDCTTVETITVAVAAGTASTTKTKIWGDATGGLQGQLVEISTGQGRNTVTTTTLVNSAYTNDFLNLHVATPEVVTPPVGGGDGVVVDGDGDGVADSADNCVDDANADQADADGDGLGDVCDDNSYAPAVGTAASDAHGTEGGTLSASGSFTDQDGNGSLTLTADNAAGTFVDNGDGTWSWSLATDDDVDSQMITVTASDGEHDDATDAFDYSAANADPVVTGVTPTRLSACEVTLGATFTDVGGADTHTPSATWMDGSTAGLTRRFTTAGSYDAVVTITDDDGGSGDRSVAGVRAYNRPSGVLAPINTTGTRSSFKIGSTVPVKIVVTGCDDLPVASGTAPTVNLLQVDGSSDVAVNEAVISEIATNGKLMRSSDGQWIYNLSTRLTQFTNAPIAVGTHTVSVNHPTFAAPVSAAFDARR